ncbi:MAG: ATP synthase F0 subunit B [Deltaproteobacteria bacterium]|nr:ATP synthase F0 subunit B [Deltaproteobacteria bacterium]
MSRKRAFSIFAVALVLGLVAVGVVWVSKAGETSSSRKIWDLVWLFINFFIFMFILVKYGRKPITEFLSKYGSDIDKDLKNTKSLLAKAEEEFRQGEGKLAELDKKIEELEELTKMQAERAREKILEGAEESSKMIISQARDLAGHEIQKARAAAKTELVEMALEEAEKKIREQLQPQDDERIINEYMDHISSPGEN